MRIGPDLLLHHALEERPCSVHHLGLRGRVASEGLPAGADDSVVGNDIGHATVALQLVEDPDRRVQAALLGEAVHDGGPGEQVGSTPRMLHVPNPPERALPLLALDVRQDHRVVGGNAGLEPGAQQRAHPLLRPPDISAVGVRLQDGAKAEVVRPKLHLGHRLEPLLSGGRVPRPRVRIQDAVVERDLQAHATLRSPCEPPLRSLGVPALRVRVDEDAVGERVGRAVPAHHGVKLLHRSCNIPSDRMSLNDRVELNHIGLVP
mmetsp:Transcript_70987/g.219146  ORF Transcript_70987/g.219146 Transcript_70987/m.219146 type:complete len:262 (+) Transcript_70987:236-1021(+)